MGRGDKKTRRGKISMGSFGNMRPRLSNKTAKAEVAPEQPAKAEKKPAAAKEKKK